MLTRELDSVLIIYTEVYYGSGDFFAAKKLIQQLETHAKNITVTWLINYPKNREDVLERVQQARKEFSQYVNVILLQDRAKLDQSRIPQPDLILFYPTIHYIDIYNFQYLHAFHVPMIQMHEYDAVAEDNHLPFKSELIEVNTGFGGLGLNLEDMVRNEAALKSIFCSNYPYNEKNQILFSYLNLENSSAINNATLTNYLAVALQLVDSSCSVDLICNSTFLHANSELKSLAIARGFSRYITVEKSKDGSFKEYVNELSVDANSSVEKTLRIFNPFPITNPQMLAVMAAAHPFIQVTGDQSLGEAMSLAGLEAGVFPFYQVMHWKRGLSGNWIKFVEGYLHEESAYVKLLRLSASNGVFDVQQFVKIWRDQEASILEDGRKIYTALCAEKNLKENYLRFIKLNFTLIKELPRTEFKFYIQLLVQLIVKLKDNNDIHVIVKRVSSISSQDERANIMMSLTEFLTMNPAKFNVSTLLETITHLQQLDKVKRMYAATTAKNIIMLITPLARDKYATSLLPELQKVSTAMYAGIVKHVKSIQLPEIFDKSLVWFQNGVASQIRWDDSFHYKKLRNTILLAVTVWEDGYGDIIKFINVYHELVKRQPTMRIYGLVHCYDSERAVVLAMLRESKVAMNQVYVCAFTAIEMALIKSAHLGRAIMNKKYIEVGFYRSEDHALYISVATPFEHINREFRTYGRQASPYIDLAEVSYVSYRENQKQSIDSQHHLVAMGLADDAVGIDITQHSHLTHEQLLAKMPDTIRRQLLGDDDIDTFLNQTLFMPAYVKGDHGLLSLYFLLAALKNAYSDKKSAVLWMPVLTCNLQSPLTQQRLRDAGIGEVVLYTKSKQRNVILIENASDNKQLRIITGRLSPPVFDLFYQLAGTMTGFAGCAGQNSFEKSVSFNVLPVFSAPSWQVPILCQCQSVITRLFEPGSPEYKILMTYIDVLIFISNALYEETRLLSEPYVLPYKAQLAYRSHKEISDILIDAYPELEVLGNNHLPHLFSGRAYELVENFFRTNDFHFLQVAWQTVCSYLQANKNMYDWLDQKIKNLIPSPEKLLIHQRDDDYLALADIMISSQYVEVDSRNLPNTYYLLTSLINEARIDDSDFTIKLIVTNSVTSLVNVASGLRDLTIVFSVAALTQMSMEELRFGVSHALALMSSYAIENPALEMRGKNQNEILDNIRADLKAGMSFCRRFFDLLKQAQLGKLNRRVENGIYNDLEYYQNLIKVIDMRLAMQHRHDLHAKEENVVELPNDAVLEEVRAVIDAWQKQEEVEDIDALSAINQMIAVLPSLRVRNSAEYHIPSLPAKRLLNRLSALSIDPHCIQLMEALSRIVNVAYHHRVAIFTDIYLIVCDKLFGPNIIPPIGPYERISELLNTFVRSKSQADAEKHAKQLLELLASNEYHYMFYNSNNKYIYWNDKITPLDQQPHSSLGARINWTDYIPTPATHPDCYDQLISWSLQSESNDIATMLFRMGLVDRQELWLKLNNTSVITSTDRCESIYFLRLPTQYRGMNSKYADSLKREFYLDFYRVVYDSPTVPLMQPLCVASLEQYINANRATLALPELFLDSIRILIQHFKNYLQQNRVEAQQFIWRFYCDKSYDFGIFSFMEFRKQISYYLVGSEIRCSGINEEYDSDRALPYLSFIIDNPPRYIPLHNIMDALQNFSMIYAHWPVKFFFDMLDMRIEDLADAPAVVKSLKECKALVTSYEAQSYLEPAISNTYREAARRAKHIKLFSKGFYEFNKASNIVSEIWQKHNFTQQLSVSSPIIEITTTQLAEMYATFDAWVVWPDSSDRDLFTKIVLNRIAAETKQEQKSASEVLLFKRLPLTDISAIYKVIEIWSSIIAEEEGKDDKSNKYYKSMAVIVNKIINHTPTLYARDLLQALMQKIEAQDRLCEFVVDRFRGDEEEKVKLLAQNEATLVEMAGKLAKEHAAMDMVEFLTYELTQKSIKRLLERLNYHAKKILKEAYTNDVDENKTEIMATMFYQNFWNQPIELRAIVINNLLISSNEMLTAAAATAAYNRAFNFIIGSLFPHNDEESQLCISLMHAYLEASHDAVRPFLLAAVLTANKMVVGNARNVAATLPKIAESLGAAGVKAGQAGHSYPKTPQHIRNGLAYLKSQARLPYRWELWTLLKAAVTKDILSNIRLMKKLLGGASFYLAVEVEMLNGETVVLRLLRENAHDEVKYGFRHLAATLQLCQHDNVKSIATDLNLIIQQAQSGAAIEINHECAKRQYELANRMYDGSAQRIVIGENTYIIRSKPVSLFACGPKFQLISKAEGTEFNTLKETHVELSCAVAMAVCQLEFELMLGGKPCDFDRHGAQMRISWHESAPGIFNVTIVHYDFGEVLPELPTATQLQHCQNFMNIIASGIFSSKNLLSMVAYGINFRDLAQQLSVEMLAYLHQHSSQPEHDLKRLRGIFKGLLALNDFMDTAFSLQPSFFHRINALFVRYTNASYVSRFINWAVPHLAAERDDNQELSEYTNN